MASTTSNRHLRPLNQFGFRYPALRAEAQAAIRAGEVRSVCIDIDDEAHLELFDQDELFLAAGNRVLARAQEILRQCAARGSSDQPRDSLVGRFKERATRGHRAVERKALFMGE